MPDIVATGSGALDHGSCSGSCSQLYSPDGLDDAGFAFDGVVTAIDPGGLLYTNTVTLDVQRWYRPRPPVDRRHDHSHRARSHVQRQQAVVDTELLSRHSPARRRWIRGTRTVIGLRH